MKFLTIADVPPNPNSGAAGTVYYTNIALRQLGHEVHEVWSPDLGVRRIRHGNLHSLLEQPIVYREALQRLDRLADYDVVLMSQPEAFLAAKYLRHAGFGGVVLNRSHGVELRANEALRHWYRRLHQKESRFPPLTRLVQYLLKRHWTEVIRWVDGVIVPSHMDRDFLLRKLAAPPFKVRVIPHGVSEEFSSRPLAARVAKEAFTGKLLYVGQYAFIKGVTLLTQIANRALQSAPGLSLTWITDLASHGPIAASLDPAIRSRVTLEPWTDHRRLPAIYDAHDIFLFPSLMEGAGKAALEAMSRGLCVVASRTGAMVDYIQDGQNGRLCEVGNVDQFVEAIVDASRNGRARQWGQQAALMAREYTWKKTALGIAHLAEELARANSTDAPSATQYNLWHAHRQAEEHAAISQPTMTVWHQMVRARLGSLQGCRVAEIGCGRGDFAICLALNGASVTALDFSPQAIDIARQRAAGQDVQVDFVVGDAQHTPFEDEAFDLVVSCECLEHVPEPARMAAELYRICRPGGRVLLTTPSYCNGQLIGWLHSWLSGRPYNSGSGVQPHENFFLFFRVKTLLKRAGFRVRSMDSRIFQFLLLPRVAPQKLRVDSFESPRLNRIFRPLGLHFFYELEKPDHAHIGSLSGSPAQAAY